MIFVGNGQGKELWLDRQQVVKNTFVVLGPIKLVDLALEVCECWRCLGSSDRVIDVFGEEVYDVGDLLTLAL